MDAFHFRWRNYVHLLALNLVLALTADIALGQQLDVPSKKVLAERRVTVHATRDQECVHIHRGAVTIELSVKLLRRFAEYRTTAQPPPTVSQADPDTQRRRALPFIEAYEASSQVEHECVEMNQETVFRGQYLVAALLEHGEVVVLSGSPLQPIGEYVVRHLNSPGRTITFSVEGVPGSFFSVVTVIR